MIGLLWPPKIRFTPKNRGGEARDINGRRYSDYWWLTLSFGHWHLNLYPAHVRGAWMSIYLKEAINAPSG